MAECVSCGKKIPEGELFCRECLSRMKGRGSRLAGVERGPEPTAARGGGAEEVAGSSARKESATDRGASPEGSVPLGVRRARGELTPASDKKVISLRPGLEEKKVEKGGFRITITLSERGYRALSRLGLGEKKKEKGEKREKKAKVAYLKPVPGGAGGRSVSPRHAEEGKSRKKGGPLSSLREYISPRHRDWDRTDRVSASTILVAALLSLALFPLNWVRVEWVAAGEASPQAVGVKGSQLGIWSYLVLSLVIVDLLYLLLWIILRRPPLPLDFGALSLAAGFLCIAFFNLALSSNGRIIEVAAATTGMDPRSLVGPQVGLSRYTQLPAYLVLVSLIAMPLAGLARLSRR